MLVISKLLLVSNYPDLRHQTRLHLKYQMFSRTALVAQTKWVDSGVSVLPLVASRNITCEHSSV
jgi:hypothetical protein